MKAEEIFNKALKEIKEFAIYEMMNISNLRVAKGIEDAPNSEDDEIVVDPWEYGEDADHVIVWGDDFYDEVSATTFDVDKIVLQNGNIMIMDKDENGIFFDELPMNSMVFITNILEKIYQKEVKFKM